MTHKALYALTFNQIHNIVEGYNRKQEREVQERWLQTRLISFYSAYSFESKDKNLKPEKFMPFAWEKKQTKKNTPKRTSAEVQELFKKLENTES